MAEQWEYKTETNCNDATLNSLGAQGWELVSVVVSTYIASAFTQGLEGTEYNEPTGPFSTLVAKDAAYYFKRRKPWQPIEYP
jgi:hypothetical protein